MGQPGEKRVSRILTILQGSPKADPKFSFQGQKSPQEQLQFRLPCVFDMLTSCAQLKSRLCGLQRIRLISAGSTI